MNELVNHVAEAIDSCLPGINSDAYLAYIARAAIAAMREPTPEMIIAGVRHENFGDMEGRWKAMIDEALK